MTTTLAPDFLRAVVLMQGFKASRMIGAQGALLMLAMRQTAFCAADLPREVTSGDVHLAGAATGSLISQGLLVSIGRVKSPDPAAKGRKTNLLMLAPHKRPTAETWLRRNGLMPPQQPELPFAL